MAAYSPPPTLPRHLDLRAIGADAVQEAEAEGLAQGGELEVGEVLEGEVFDHRHAGVVADVGNACF